MGVRGLTGYIARHAELYLKPYELHDCNLVIDGDNLACNLYKAATGTYSAFGGDYDDFYRAVVDFFHVLEECNIQAYVLMDGGYEERKLRTVAQRMRGKISAIKRISPCDAIPVFPLHMKEVFVDAVKDMGVPVMRCVFEADDELAALARKLNCPVLSYDSDFYIFNVIYIPLITLTVKAHTKKCKPEKANNERLLRKTEAKHVEKRTKAERIMTEIVVDNVERSSKKGGKTYKYLDCCIYRVENLIQRGSLSKEKLPLFAAMLGNDYIARSAFRNFFLAGMGKIGRSKKLDQQQKRIRTILKWLKGETIESALERIMTRLKKPQRESLMAQVRAATEGYSNEMCHSYDFFHENYAEALERYPAVREDDENDNSEVAESDEEESEEDIETADEDEAKSAEEIEEDVANEELEDQENEENQSANEELQSAESEENSAEDESNESPSSKHKTERFPKWFLQKLYTAEIPRYFVDLLHLRKYINSPLIEHFPFNDCHELAIPILTHIFTLLHSVEGETYKTRYNEDGTPKPIEMVYMTRAPRITCVRYYHYGLDESLKGAYNPKQPNPQLLRHVFDTNLKHLNSAALFEKLPQLPADLQLYFLGIVYWLQKSPHCDYLHLHSLIIGLVLLRTIDSTIPPERDLKAFQKRFSKIIKKEREVRDKECSEGIKRGIKPDLLTLSIPERISHIPKSDCYLVQDQMLKHYHMQEIFKKKYDLFSSTVLHAFAEFQSVVFQLRALNALLDCPYEAPRMGQLYCGVLLYNLYDLLRSRLDLRYYVENFIFKDSRMMFDFYGFLVEWVDEFIPQWKRSAEQPQLQAVQKKVLKKQKQAARKKAAKEAAIIADVPKAETFNDCLSDKQEEEDDFIDLNNKFCAFLEIR